ncbi:MAG: LacI family DNA-binding transcriptional regulator, partial [Acidimicrobiales bacterium]
MTPPGRPTMREVASAAGVSLKTVSRVVNEEGGVREDKADRVRVAIAQLGYRRNEVARHLRPGQSSFTLGLIIEDVANPFYSTMVGGCEEVARDHGFMVLTASSNEEPDRERELIIRMLRRQVDGLLVVPAGQDHAWLGPEMAMGIPAVFLDRPPGNLEADVVVLDNTGGAKAAVTYLLARGHTRIGVVGDGPSIWTAARRVAGYRAALRGAGIPVDWSLLRLGPHGATEAEAAAVD